MHFNLNRSASHGMPFSDTKALAHSQRTLSFTSFNISKNRFMSGPWWQDVTNRERMQLACCLVISYCFRCLPAAWEVKHRPWKFGKGRWVRDSMTSLEKNEKKNKKKKFSMESIWCSHCFWLCERSRRKGTRRAFFFTPPLAWKPDTAGDRETGQQKQRCSECCAWSRNIQKRSKMLKASWHILSPAFPICLATCCIAFPCLDRHKNCNDQSKTGKT